MRGTDRYISVSVGMGNIADRRTSSGEITTLVWTVLLVLGLFVLHVRGDGSAANCMLVFGGMATLAALSGLLQARPRPTQTRAWFRTHRELSFRYLVENVSSSGAGQLRSMMLGAVAGLAAVGYVRASEILMGPFLVLLMGLSQVAVPETSEVFHRDSRRLARFCLAFGGRVTSAQQGRRAPRSLATTTTHRRTR